jgi:hypothetical protein
VNDLTTAYEALSSAAKRYRYQAKLAGRIKAERLNADAEVYEAAAGMVQTLIRENEDAD